VEIVGKLPQTPNVTWKVN